MELLFLVLLYLISASGLCRPTMGVAYPHCTNYTFTVTISDAQELSDASVPPPAYPYTNQAFLAFLYQNITYESVSGTFDIHAELCEPEIPKEDTIVLFLLAGITYNSAYWYVTRRYAYRDPDFAECNSYVQYATSNGYYTLAIDILGTGESEHPDPLNDVQAAMNAGIVHQIVDIMRSGTTITTSKPIDWSSSTTNFVLVGHSGGSLVGIVVSFNTPDDFAGYILTGIAIPQGNFVGGFMLDELKPAAQAFPLRFGGLDPGYLAMTNKSSRRDSFYGDDGTFDPALFDIDWATQDTVSWGSALSAKAFLLQNSTSTRPVFAIIGAQDALFCSENGTRALGPANCTSGPDGQVGQLAGVFPDAPYAYLVVPDTAHDLNLHYSAPTTFGNMQKWMEQNGL